MRQISKREAGEWIDYEGVREALTVFESYEGPEQYAPNKLLIQLMRSLLLAHDRNFRIDTFDKRLPTCKRQKYDYFCEVDDVSDVDNERGNFNRFRKEISSTQLDDKIDQSTPADIEYPKADLDIAQETTPMNEAILVQRNSFGGRAWLSSKKARGSRRKKGYINRNKKKRNAFIETFTPHTHSNQQIPSSIIFDRNGDGDSFAFHSQSSMTEDN